MENDDGANQQSDPTEMEENSNFNDRPQISRQNSVKSLESLQPLASSTMIGDDLTMIGKSVENDLNSSTQKVSYTINMEQIKIVVLYNEHLTVTSFQQNLQAPINTNDQDLVPVNNLVEQEICQPTSNLNDVLNNIDSNHGKPNNKNVSALSQLNRYPASEDVDKENKAAATSVIHSSNVENIGSASMQDNAMDFTIGEDFSEDITEIGKNIYFIVIDRKMSFLKLKCKSGAKIFSDLRKTYFKTGIETLVFALFWISNRFVTNFFSFFEFRSPRTWYFSFIKTHN